MAHKGVTIPYSLGYKLIGYFVPLPDQLIQLLFTWESMVSSGLYNSSNDRKWRTTLKKLSRLINVSPTYLPGGYIYLVRRLGGFIRLRATGF